ncbi:hypothetical protein [Actinoallomurus bryophytorum]|uniref:hypothetical protein n=1 Tax=Actinoallomurus bryophytorum TaxID=1490222 RepID=UPI0011522B28
MPDIVRRSNFAEDRDPVQEFAAEGSGDAFADGVHPWRLRQGFDDLWLFGFDHLGERGGEDRIAVMNQEAQRAEAVTQVRGEIPGLPRRPRTGRVRGHSAEVRSSGAVLDEHQHVQPLEQHRLYYQEVTREDRV